MLDECSHEFKEGHADHITTLRRICALGGACGLATFHRYRANLSSEGHAYTPAIDLLWAIDMSEHASDYDAYLAFTRLLGLSDEEARYIPLAAFEVESSDPTTRVVSTDLMNLLATRARFSFEVIRVRDDREGCMSMRRAEAIARTFQYFEGYRSVHIVDSSYIDSLDMHDTDQPECRIPEFAGMRQWMGPCKGLTSYRDLCSAKKSRECIGLGLECKLSKNSDDGARCALALLAWSVGLVPCYSYMPTEALPQGDFHVPKLDTVLFLQLSRAQRRILSRLLSSSRMPVRSDACHVPLFGFELEGGLAGKHSIGGIVSLSRYAHFKVLLTKRAEGTAGVQRAMRAYSGFYGKNTMFALPAKKLAKYTRKLAGSNACSGIRRTQ